ncbi:aminotransferase class I/II-fold pyridoxal phosphate-dependent enzyme [Alphaproteobacteria bacterium]|nr:aminotransferase class I/II-fold pyridoxal phosphate-dependent enzyme [Alphaproteobacteria bacterium]
MSIFQPSDRSFVPPFYAMEILKEANKLENSGTNVFHLEVGEPSAQPPPAVLKRAREIIDNGIPLKYTDALGIVDLRKKIAEYYFSNYRVKVNFNNIAITNGSSPGFLLALLASFNEGAKVGIGMPCYPAYRNMMLSIGIEPVEIRTSLDDRFQPTIKSIENVGTLDGLLIASPSNPSGTMIEEHRLNEIIEFCEMNQIRLISDEIYHGITYDKKADTCVGKSNSAIVLNGFSKYFCMTGWRLGWVVVPDDLIGSIERLSQNLFISTNSLSQLSSIAAFDDLEYCSSKVKEYSLNREILLNLFSKIGVDNFAPVDGAFYIYANISNLTNNSKDFCRKLLYDTGVAITPGIDFDREIGSSYIRVSYASSKQVIYEASNKISDWLK